MCFLATAAVVRWATKLSQLQQALPLLPAKTLVSVPWRCSKHNFSCLLEVLCSPFLYSDWYLQSSASVLSFLLVLLISKRRAIPDVAGINLYALGMLCSLPDVSSKMSWHSAPLHVGGM